MFKCVYMYMCVYMCVYMCMCVSTGSCGRQEIASEPLELVTVVWAHNISAGNWTYVLEGQQLLIPPEPWFFVSLLKLLVLHYLFSLLGIRLRTSHLLNASSTKWLISPTSTSYKLLQLICSMYGNKKLFFMIMVTLAPYFSVWSQK